MRKTISGTAKFCSPYEAAAVCLLAIIGRLENAFVAFFGHKKGVELVMDSDPSQAALDEIWCYYSYGDRNIINDLAEAAKPEWAADLSDEQITQITGLLARDDFEEAMVQLFNMIGFEPVKYVTITADDLPEGMCDDIRSEYF